MDFSPWFPGETIQIRYATRAGMGERRETRKRAELCPPPLRIRVHLLLAELFDLVNLYIQVLAPPGIGGRAHLVAQVVEKLLLIGDLVPDLREEGGAAEAVSKGYAVHVRVEMGQQVRGVLIR